jgi:adenine phosphoribosyltransferase
MDPRIAKIRETIRDIPDFPKPGILFRDITPLLYSIDAFRETIDILAERYRPMGLDHIVAVESRGFIFGGPLALQLGVGLHLVRKAVKLPGETDEVSYDLEYGSATLQIHKGELEQGGKALVLDDLLATGGTAAAAAQLVEKQGATVAECAFIIELAALQGRDKLSWPTYALLTL